MNKTLILTFLDNLNFTKVVKFFFIAFFIFSFFFFNQTEAAITYEGKGAFQSGTTALTVPIPTGSQNGDVFLLFVESANQAVTTPSGWTLIGTQQGTGTAGVAGGVRLAVFYKVVSGLQSSASVSDTGDHQTAIIMNFRGVDTSAPINISAGSVGSLASTAMTFPTVTTTVANAGIVLAAAMDTDLASTATVTNWTNANIASLTELHDQTVTTGAGGGLAIAAGAKVSAGATGTSSATGSTSVTHAYMTIALKPLSDTWTVSGTSTNTSASGATVRVAINGTLQAQTSTLNCSGNPCTWSVSGITAGVAGSIITAWISGVTDDLESTAVTKYSSGTTISGMVLNKNTLTIGSNQNTTLSTTELGGCDSDTGCVSEDIMHTSNSGALNVTGSNSYDDAVLSILASNTLTVNSASSESVTTDRIINSGTLTSSTSPTYTLTGRSGTLFANNGTFTPDKSTVTISSDADATVNSGSLTLFNLSSVGSGEKSLGTGLTFAANGTLSVLNGTFNPGTYLATGAGANTLTVASGATLKVGASTFTGNYSSGFTTITLAGGSTVDYYASGNQTILNTSYYNLNTTGSGTKTLSGTTTVSGVLTIGTGTTLSASSYDIYLAQSEGNIPLIENGTLNAGTGTVYYSSNSNIFLSSGYPTFYNVSITGIGTRKLAENLMISNTLTLSGGTLDTNTSNYTINAGNIVLSGGTLTPNASTINLTGTGTVFNYTSGTYTPGTSTIKITNSSATGKTFAGGGQTYNNIWYAPGTGTGSLTISGSNTFNNFKDDGTIAHSLLFTQGTTQNIASWTVTGNAGNLITINSALGTGTHTLNYTGTGTVNSDYLNIQHSVATPASTWYAGGNSVNNQAVVTAGSGWVFGVITRTISQGPFRLFGNENSLTLGNPLTSQNMSSQMPGNDARVRIMLDVGGTALTQGSEDFYLQFAQKSGTCDTAFSGESYQDVGIFSTLAFQDNPIPNDRDTITTNPLDPHIVSGEVVPQSYIESNKFGIVNDVAPGNSAMFDFSLRYTGVQSQDSYCLRIIKSSGELLDNYTYIPELISRVYRSRRGTAQSIESGVTPSGNTIGGTKKDGADSIVLPLCSDTIDNDSDTLIDTLDPQCHMDGNINNEYVPTHNSETIAPVTQTGGGAGDNGGDLGLNSIYNFFVKIKNKVYNLV